MTALVPSETACLASSPGSMRRTAVWISLLDLWWVEQFGNNMYEIYTSMAVTCQVDSWIAHRDTYNVAFLL